MSHADFVHLRVHTAYSLSEGAVKTKDLVKMVKAQKMPAVAVTDTGNLFGAMEISSTLPKEGIQPILGMVIRLTRSAGEDRFGRRPEPEPLVLLAQSGTGYDNLGRIVSHAFMKTPTGDTPQVSEDVLAQFATDLICLSGGPAGPVGARVLEGRDDEARAQAERLAAIFPGRFYIELMRHCGPGETPPALEADSEPGQVDIAYDLDLPLVATNDVFFTTEAMYEAHDALLCIAEGRHIEDTNRRRLTPHHYFKSARQMRDLFADLPEAVDNTLVIARRCAAKAPFRKPILPKSTRDPNAREEDELRRLSREGLEARLDSIVYTYTPGLDAAGREAAAKPYRDRLDYELDVIIKMGFPGYFLIVAEFIQWSKTHGIPVGPGRGSGAGSVVAWSLTITDLDPLRFGLLFERFLNPERVSMPDFDIDFCQDRRDEVIQHVRDLYGHDRVAQIITFGKLQARAVLRDVGRVLGMPFGQTDKICKLVPNNPANPVTLQEAIDGEPALQRARNEDEQVARLINIALKLEGLYRHASTHAAGVVIGDRPLDELVPLYRDPRSDMPVTQFSMKYVEQTGLIKFDFLGLKTLTVITTAERLIREVDPDFDINRVPLDDKPSFDMLARGEGVGVFQLESSGMRDVLRKLRPDKFEDIIAVVALYRPGPMDNIPRYIAVKHGSEKAEYLHPLLKPILEETYGIMIYQEQVMQAAQVLAGYSLGQADLLRRAMGKKIKEEMDAQRESFTKGAVAHGVDKDTAGLIFDQIAKFAGYGFNKSHAAAYALVAYQTAYLKANWPVEFMAASMTLDMHNTDKLAGFRQELNRLKIGVVPPDVNQSDAMFAVRRTAKAPRGDILYALGALKQVGPQAMAELVAERRRGGAYGDLFDLSARLGTKVINKRMMESLTKAGAFDHLNANRAQVMNAIDMVLRYGQAAQEERQSNQVSLFGGPGGEAVPKPPMPAIDPWMPMEQLKRELEAVGFYLSAHPLDAYDKVMDRLGVVRAGDLAAKLEREGAAGLKLAGTLIAKQERRSAKGSRFAFAQMSDPTGVFEVTLFSEVLSQARDLLEPGVPLLIEASGEWRDDTVRLTAQNVRSLDDVAASSSSRLTIQVAEERALAQIRRVIEREPEGRGRITLELDIDLEGERQVVRLELPKPVSITPALRAALKLTPGVTDAIET
ncbi:DNA polymerase III subunit alpha [Tistrella bauzanensis]|uniref:DNA polymerase III subunit alpha n=1 Tax=Tistrella arctica TaxID=3133430 RepID=A0ABU9YEP6_9PROT